MATPSGVAVVWTSAHGGGECHGANPAVRLIVEGADATTHVRLSLDCTEDAAAEHQLVVCRDVDGGMPLTSLPDETIVTKSKLLPTPSITVAANLAPGGYTVVCCRESDAFGSQDVTGQLSVEGAAAVAPLAPAEALVTVSAKSRMSGAALCNGPASAANPQFLLTIAGDAERGDTRDVFMTLDLSPTTSADAVGCHVLRCSEHEIATERLQTMSSTDPRCIAGVPLTEGGSAVLELGRLAPGAYRIVAFKARSIPCLCSVHVCVSPPLGNAADVADGSDPQHVELQCLAPPADVVLKGVAVEFPKAPETKAATVSEEQAATSADGGAAPTSEPAEAAEGSADAENDGTGDARGTATPPAEEADAEPTAEEAENTPSEPTEETAQTADAAGDDTTPATITLRGAPVLKSHRMSAQALQTVRDACVRDGGVFIDEAFNTSSFLPHVGADDVAWLRLAEVSPAVELFANGVDIDDPATGPAELAWVADVVAAVHRTCPHVLPGHLAPSTPSSAGAYVVRLFLDGAWRALLIDDRLPFDASTMAPLHSVGCDRLEVGPALVEKALAKAAGGYGAFADPSALGGPQGVLTALTGITDVRSIALDAGATDEWWSMLMQSFGRPDRDHQAAAAIVAGIPRTSDADADGNVTRGAFVVTAAVQVGSYCLVKCLPLRDCEAWGSTWASGSEEWQRRPQVARACGVDIDHPSEDPLAPFWLSAAELCELCSVVLVADALQLPAATSTTVFESRWSEEDNGVESMVGTHLNRQLQIAADSPNALVTVRLTRNTSDASPALGFTVVVPAESADEARDDATVFATALPRGENMLCRSALQTSVLTVSSSFTMPATVTRVMLLPFSGKVPAPLRLEVESSSASVRVSDAQPLITSRVSHGWREGGCRYQADANPRVKLTLASPARVVLEAALEESVGSPGMYVCLVRGAPESQWPADNAMVHRTPFSRSQKQRLYTGLLEAGVYTVWTTLGKPTDCSVVLSCASAAAVRMDPM